ncbi:hypothetical protein GGI15_002388 [Coemansia interrupta]|uniref:Uncharacterized protein n=1 Tax=Coemansia interrupta TaxID=1126814 RepID=A0A9W8HF82_9FUNG|nr:hypothetical protein GGI15_002388 [Coemansia interrupta]
MKNRSKGTLPNSDCLLNIAEDARKNLKSPSPLSVIDKAGAAAADPASRKTFRVEAPSDLLSRLQAFLPQIAEANKKLEVDAAEDPSKLDIENVNEDDEQYIEMDLGLGVFDMKPKKNSSDTSEIIIGRTNALNNDSNSGETDSDDGSDDDGGAAASSRIIISPSSIIERQQKERRSKPPQIEVLSGDSEDMESDSDCSSGSGSESGSASNSGSSTDSDSAGDVVMKD